MYSLQEAYNSIYIKEEVAEEINIFEDAYQFLLEGGMSDDDATEVVNYIYDHYDELGEITIDLQENVKSKIALTLLGPALKMLNMLPKKQAVKAVTTAVKQGGDDVVKAVAKPSLRQGNLLTRSGKAQNFTGGRTPFTSTDPVPAASSLLPKNAPAPVVTPGQMTIPGLSDRAMDVKRLTGRSGITMGTKELPKLPHRAPKPEWGPGAVKPTTRTSRPELRPDGVAPKPEFGTPPGAKIKTPPAPRTNRMADAEDALKRTSPMTAPKISPDKPRGGVKADEFIRQSKADRRLNNVLNTVRSGIKKPIVKDALAKTALASGVVGVPAGMYYGGKDNTASITQAQQNTKLAQQRAETQAALNATPAPDPVADASDARQETAKQNAERRRQAAKDFDNKFAAARSAGKSEFTWRGRRYHTRYAEEE